MELLEASQARDLGAFDAFMQRYERLVYKVAIHFVREPEAAFDVSQTVFLKAFQGLAQFRREATPRTWLLRITYNESIDCLRRNRLRVDAHDPLEEGESLAVEAAQEREALRLDDQARVARAMAGLNQRHRLAVVLRYFQGLGIQEIAQVLGCSEGVTKNILFRSLRSLRATLTGTA
jgi:RNA polymerase sigma-70 factor (ECF subfamily)